MPQPQSADIPHHKEEEKKDKNQLVQNKQTNAREVHKSAPSSQGDHNAKRTKTREQRVRHDSK